MNFKPGDFIRRCYDKEHFYIYEGEDRSISQYYKKFSVAVEYDPKTNGKWDSSCGKFNYDPLLLFDGKNGSLTIDANEENTTYEILPEKDKEKALEVLSKYGYYWDDKDMTLCDTSSGEIVFKIAQPKIEYHGELIHVITKSLKDFLLSICRSKAKPSYSGYSGYNCYGNYDYYDD